MKRNTHNSTISINQNTPEVSHKDAVTSTDSHPALDGEATASTVSMYASFYWLINYIKMCNCRFANDVYTSFMSYWFPGRVLLPPHLLHLIQVHNRLRAERESHTVTYSRERPGALSMRNIVNTIKSYILSSEDEAGIRYTPKDLGYLANDREPMFVIVDSSCVSNPSSRELLIDNNRYHTRDPILKRHFNKNVMPVDVPSTSKDLRNDFMAAAPLLMESESTDEMQVIDINLQSDNELLIGSDSECDNDSIVMSYLKNKDAFLDFEDWSEDSSSDDYFVPSSPLDSPSSTQSILDLTNIKRVAWSPPPIQNDDGVKEATEFLHQDQDFLIAAEMADDNMLRILIDQGTNIHLKDHLGRNALHFAVQSEKQEVVDRLLKAGVNPNIQDDLGMTPLTLCLMRSPTLAMASLLLKYGALLTPRLSPVEPGLFLQFVMMCVPTKEEENILHLLVVNAGALVNDPDAPGGRQPLHFAAMSNNTRLINILVNLGGDLFEVNHRNETPKQVAAIFRNKEAYTLLQRFEDMSHINGARIIPAKERDKMDSEESRRESQGSS